MKTIVAVLILAFAALPGSAQQNGELPTDGNGLLNACNAVIQTVDSPATINDAKGHEFARPIGIDGQGKVRTLPPKK